MIRTENPFKGVAEINSSDRNLAILATDLLVALRHSYYSQVIEKMEEINSHLRQEYPASTAERAIVALNNWVTHYKIQLDQNIPDMAVPYGLLKGLGYLRKSVDEGSRDFLVKFADLTAGGPDKIIRKSDGKLLRVGAIEKPNDLRILDGLKDGSSLVKLVWVGDKCYLGFLVQGSQGLDRYVFIVVNKQQYQELVSPRKTGFVGRLVGLFKGNGPLETAENYDYSKTQYVTNLNTSQLPPGVYIHFLTTNSYYVIRVEPRKNEQGKPILRILNGSYNFAGRDVVFGADVLLGGQELQLKDAKSGVLLLTTSKARTFCTSPKSDMDKYTQPRS